jgi:hypothetical protein
MAARKEEPAERATYQEDFDASDLPRPRMRIVTGTGMYQKMRPPMFSAGDIVIGDAADDPDASVLYDVTAGGDGVLVYVLSHGKHETTDKDAEGKKADFTRFEFGTGPAWAKTVHEYVMLVPEHDTMLPVMVAMTPGSRSAIGSINKARMYAQAKGKDPRTIAFRLTTKPATGGGNSWDSYVATAVEPDEKLQLMATTMGDQLIPAQRQLAAAGASAETAAF